jgi:hypothetical protein
VVGSIKGLKPFDQNPGLLKVVRLGYASLLVFPSSQPLANRSLFANPLEADYILKNREQPIKLQTLFYQ